MTLYELIEDLQALRTRTQAYERKYGVTSQDFYALYQQGLLDDEGFDQSTEFVRWASAYAMQMGREAEFEARSRSFVSELKETTSLRRSNKTSTSLNARLVLASEKASRRL